MRIQRHRLLSCQKWKINDAFADVLWCVVKCNWCWRWMSVGDELQNSSDWGKSMSSSSINNNKIFAKAKNKAMKWCNFCKNKKPTKKINDYRILLWAIAMTWLYKVVAMWLKNCINFGFLHSQPQLSKLSSFSQTRYWEEYRGKLGGTLWTTLI